MAKQKAQFGFLLSALGATILLAPHATAWAGERGEFGLRLGQEGLLWKIVAVSPHGPAGRAGLRVGDYVIRVNNLTMPTEEQLRRLVSNVESGETFRFVVTNSQGIAEYNLVAEKPVDGRKR